MMPVDFAIDRNRLVNVKGRTGADLPFSKGIMATSILATGVETAEAYGIAASVQEQLVRHGVRDLDAEQVAAIAARTIGQVAGPETAERYRAWRRAKRAGRPVVLCIGGAPGVGKSTFASRLALRLGLTRVVPTDAIREVLRTVIPDPVLPELHLSTFERTPHASPDEPGTVAFLRQARAVSAASAAVASRMVQEGRSVALEGVHLIPGDVSARLRGSGAIVVEVLLTLDDEATHRAHLLRRSRTAPGRNGHRHVDHLPTIRSLQEVLRRFAMETDVMQQDIESPEGLTQRIVDQVVAAVDAARVSELALQTADA